MDPALLGPSPELLPKHCEVVPLSAKELGGGGSSTHWFYWPQSFTITIGSVQLDEVLASTLVLLNDLTHFLVFWAPPKVTSRFPFSSPGCRFWKTRRGSCPCRSAESPAPNLAPYLLLTCLNRAGTRAHYSMLSPKDMRPQASGPPYPGLQN